MEKVRFGVIGIGNMGTSHSGWLVGNRIEGAELTAVCDIDEKRRDSGSGRREQYPVDRDQRGWNFM